MRDWEEVEGVNVKFTTQFQKDYRRAKRRGMPIERLKRVVAALAVGDKLPDRNEDHELGGNWSGYRECHVLPDWLLIYHVRADALTLVRVGSHADLFSR